MKNFYAVLLMLSLLLTLVIPATAQTAEPTPLPSILGTEAAPVEEVSTPVENVSDASQLVRVVEVLAVLIIALITSNLVALGAGGVAIVRLLFNIAGFITSLTPTPLDDAAVKRSRAEFDAKYPSEPVPPRTEGRDQ